ncbi:VOC family protein [soil metagenome]
MAPRLTLVTLGVKNVKASRQFYEKLGFKAAKASVESTVFMMAGGVVISLFGHDDLARDAEIEAEPPPRFRGVSLAQNVRSDQEVDAALAAALKAGARLVKPAKRAEWGGYTAYFADPDGHLWEIAHNPFFEMDERGLLALP